MKKILSIIFRFLFTVLCIYVLYWIGKQIYEKQTGQVEQEIRVNSSTGKTYFATWIWYHWDIVDQYSYPIELITPELRDSLKKQGEDYLNKLREKERILDK